MTCACGKPARRAGLCWACVKAEQRRRNVESNPDAPVDVLDGLVAAALVVARCRTDEDADQAFDHAVAELVRSCRRFSAVDKGVDKPCPNCGYGRSEHPGKVA